MFCKISDVAYVFPEKVLTNEELAAVYPGWSPEKIFEKTGINQRYVCKEDECASDLAERSARELFQKYSIDPKSIDFVILATQSPDYLLPTTACILQDKLGIPKTSGAIDFNQGCSAYIYGLALANGLVRAGTATRVLLIMAETYSRHIHPMDKSVRTIFGDAAAATLLTQSETQGIGEFVLGTDGSGYRHLIVPVGGMRDRRQVNVLPETTDESENVRTDAHLFMDGPEVFTFTISVVPKTVKECLSKNNLTLGDVDLFVFHQANKYMLDFLRKKISIPPEKFYMNFADCGNTVSATIPIALARASADGTLRKGMKVMLVGFGVGLSWGATIVTW